MLFSTFERNNYDPISRQESSYEFLDRSAWKLAAWVRNKYEEFSKDYQPDEEFNVQLLNFSSILSDGFLPLIS